MVAHDSTRPLGPAHAPLGIEQATEWPLLPIPVALPAFPTNLLPAWLRAFVEGVADAVQVAVDVPALHSLSALSAVASKTAVIEIGGRKHPLNLWSWVPLSSGGGKTPVDEVVRRPLEELDREMAAQFADAARRDDVLRRTLLKRRAKLESDASKLEDEQETLHLTAQAEIISKEIELLRSPEGGRLLIEDATVERLVVLLGANRRLALISDEAGILLEAFGRHTRNAGALDALLKAHSGSTLRVARVSRPDLVAHNPALTLAILAQPVTLEALVRDRVAGDRGVLARFLFALPTTTEGARRSSMRPLSSELEAAYAQAVRRLGERELHDLRDAALPVLGLTDAGVARYQALLSEIDGRLHPEHGDLRGIVAWAQKIPTHAARFTGLLHLLDGVLDDHAVSPCVPVETVERGIALTRYALAHAAAVLTSGSPMLLADDRFVLERIRTLGGAGRATFRARELHRGMQHRFRTARELKVVLGRLGDAGYVRRLPTVRGVAGHPAHDFEIHPHLRRRGEPGEAATALA